MDHEKIRAPIPRHSGDPDRYVDRRAQQHDDDGGGHRYRLPGGRGVSQITPSPTELLATPPAGRAGRRGSAVSTVVTYAQNTPHDNHYFENPELIISGEPTLPGVDTQNP